MISTWFGIRYLTSNLQRGLLGSSDIAGDCQARTLRSWYAQYHSKIKILLLGIIVCIPNCFINMLFMCLNLLYLPALWEANALMFIPTQCRYRPILSPLHIPISFPKWISNLACPSYSQFTVQFIRNLVSILKIKLWWVVFFKPCYPFF